MIGLQDCWEADASNGSYRALTDLYAHWVITRVDQSSGVRYYPRESKPALLRLFLGRDRSFISTVRITMTDPYLLVTIPLASFGYQGKVGKGQTWSTKVYNDDQNQPYFRIGPSTSATIEATAKSSDAVEVKTTGVILDTLRSITAIITPGGSLLTTLNREPLNQASAAVDNALGNIWSNTQDEAQVSGRQLSEWYEKSGFLIEVYVPAYVKIANKEDDERKNGQPVTVEKMEKRIYWLRLSCPRYSIFDPAQACDSSEPGDQPTQPGKAQGVNSTFFSSNQGIAFRRRLSATRVLNFPLAQGKTLSQFISDHAWYTQFLRLSDPATPAPPAAPDAKVDPTKAPVPARDSGPTVQARTNNDFAGLCTQIVDRLYWVGLPALDAKIGLWAVITGSSDLVGLRANFNIPQCLELLPEGADSVNWRFDAPPPRTGIPQRPGKSKTKKSRNPR